MDADPRQRRLSQRRGERVEQVFGWNKTIGAVGKLRYLVRNRSQLWLELTVAASPDGSRTLSQGHPTRLLFSSLQRGALQLQAYLLVALGGPSETVLRTFAWEVAL